ncbi:MAG TPA: hypothetical protein PKA63_12105 [Oligoflexia bacterium]|nr:hypothetical protein [Oligoflexia bacterium]HMP49398.1 hypothetical protein [Oligoflexia bacterium]
MIVKLIEHKMPLRFSCKDSEGKYQTLSESQFGNGMLEMLLFLPFALMVLFVGTDIGLGLLDRAMVTDVVREAQHDQLIEGAISLYQVSGSGLEINNAVVEALSSRIADRLNLELGTGGRRMVLASGSSNYRVQVSPVLLNIDTTSGAITSYEIFSEQVRNPGFSARSVSPEMPYISETEYLDGQLATRTSNASPFSLLSPVPDAPGERYLPVSVAILVSVEAVSPSINPAFMRTVLGGLSAFQIHELHGVRN